jgi:cardiolipin synthase
MGKALNLANLLTLFRIVLLPVFVTLLAYRLFLAGLLVLCLAAATDALDGLVARVFNQQTAIGTFLDPLADKLLAVGSFVTLAIIGEIPVWFLITVVSRDVIVSLGTLVIYLHEGSVEIRPTWIGKGATLAQSLTIIATLGARIAGRGEAQLPVLLLVTLALTVVSGIQYVWRGLTIAGSTART